MRSPDDVSVFGELQFAYTRIGVIVVAAEHDRSSGVQLPDNREHGRNHLVVGIRCNAFSRFVEQFEYQPLVAHVGKVGGNLLPDACNAGDVGVLVCGVRVRQEGLMVVHVDDCHEPCGVNPAHDFLDTCKVIG